MSTTVMQAVSATPVKAANSGVRAENSGGGSAGAEVEGAEGKSFKALYDDVKKSEKTPDSKSEKQGDIEGDTTAETPVSGKELPESVHADEEAVNTDRFDSLRINGSAELAGATHLESGEAPAPLINEDELISNVAGMHADDAESRPDIDAPVMMTLGISSDKRTVSTLQNSNNANMSATADNASSVRGAGGQMSMDATADLSQTVKASTAEKPADFSGQYSGMKETPVSARATAAGSDGVALNTLDKLLDRPLSADKSTLDAVIAKLDTISTTAGAEQRVSNPLPLSTALNYSSTSSLQNASSVFQTVIAETPGQPEWNQSMSKQVVWMANQNIRSAEVRLNPANLGTIEVRIEMEDEQVNVAFSSRNIGVRDAVEMALPRLREMMEEQGLNLGDADISQDSFFTQQDESFSQQPDSGVNHMADSDQLSDAHATEMQTTAMRSSDLLVETVVDYYI